MSSAADQFFTAGDVTLHYREAGRGEPILMIHGYARNLDDWTGLSNGLARSHRVIALDVRGFGKSSKFGDPARFGPLMADDAIRLLDHLRIPQAHVVGQSMGALIVANIAARYPSRVMTATLISGPFFNAGATDEAAIGADLKAGKGITRFIQTIFPGMDSKTMADFNAQVLAQNDLASLIAVVGSLHTLDVTNGHAPKVPALIVCGTADSLLPASRQLAVWWPGARLVEASGANHATVIDSPETLAGIRTMIH
jgi:pimeloyl-ACP methyl ester carboxylesterase